MVGLEVRSGDFITDRYELIEEIGRGGIGAVWRARDKKRDRDIAIKVITPLDHQGEHSDNKVGRFVREARAMAKLKSPHIVKIFDHGSCPAPDGEGELVYIAMELLTGESLRARVKREKGMSPASTMRVLAHVGRALALSHQRGIIHRDLKPANIFLCLTPDAEFTAKVLDFGMVKSVAAPLATVDVRTETGRPLGTPYYMSPEQARGLESVDHRSDLWAMGIMAYECLVGERPFKGKSLTRVFTAIAIGEIPVPSDHAEVPPGFDNWFLRACERDKQKRFQSAKMMVDELQEVLVDAATLAKHQTALGATLSDVMNTTSVPPGVGERTLVASPVSTGSSFVGRQEQMRMMDEAVAAHCRVITLRGPQGVGRSRLAREWATRRRDQFAGGVWLTDLRGVTDAATMWQRIAQSMSARLGDSNPSVRLGRALTGLGRVLAIFERASGVREPLSAAIAELLREAPNAVFVVTARKPLDVPTERIIKVTDFDFPSFGVRGTMEQISEYPAVELFLKRAFAFKRTLVSDRSKTDDLAAVSRRANGNPLALEALAVRTDAIELKEMVRQLDSTLIQPGGTTLIDRDSIVKGCVRWSLGSMPSYLRSTMVQCGSFSGGFTPQAAEAVVDLGGWSDAPSVAEALIQLHRRGMLRETPRAGELRYDMHPVVHDLCARWLNAENGLGDTTRSAVLSRHGRFYAQLGSEEAIEALRRRGGWMRRSRYLVDLQNTVVAAVRARDARDGGTAAACSLAVAIAEGLLGRHAIAAQELVAPVSVNETPSGTRIRCLMGQGLALIHCARLEAAHQALSSANQLARAGGARRLQAATLRALGELQLVLGRPSVAYNTCEQARAMSAHHGDRLGIADALILIADAKQQVGDSASATHHLSEARVAYHELGAKRREGGVLERLGKIHLAAGELDRARSALDAALAIQRELGNRWSTARLTGIIGEVALQANVLDEAVTLLEQASGRGRELGACDLEGRFMGALGSANAALGNHERAWELMIAGEQVLRKDRPNGSIELAMLLCRRARSASGSRPKRSTAASEATSRAAAPSLTPEALPAVTLPPSRNGARSLASLSRLVRRGCSSFPTRISSPRRCGTGMATISLARRPFSCAAAARCCERRAKASWSAREMP